MWQLIKYSLLVLA